MSDIIKHECGIALLRLLKPLEYYREKYGTYAYGLNKLYLLMEKQHNRGQDGAGIATIKIDPQPGIDYIAKKKYPAPQPIKRIFTEVFEDINKKLAENHEKSRSVEWLKENIAHYGELYLGHLRYATHGKNDIRLCHPFHRENNWMTRNLVMAGNFNLTNVDKLFNHLIELGQHPTEKSDTITVLEKIGHFLDVDVQRIFDKYKDLKYSNKEITDFITNELDIKRILRRSARDFDGGYAMAGLIGHGDAFVLRDPNGIRPCYYYYDDEIAIVASERPAIQTTFNVHFNKIKEVPPGNALIIRKSGKLELEEILKPRERKACSFERIYFSRGTDIEIYNERKKLGYLLAPKVLEAVNHDYDHTVFSFIPNTAEVAFLGLMKGVEEALNQFKQARIKDEPDIPADELVRLLNLKPRVEKIAVKDVKMRTFITEDSSRNEMVQHVYDITYGSVQASLDTLVMVDDSIVRGTTLEQSILSILDRLGPKKIIIVSSAPQIRYPDCYGIDMSKIQNFIAFRAAVALIKERNMECKLDDIYQKCKAQENKPAHEMVNYVKEMYDQFTVDEISNKIAAIVRPKHIFSEVQIIYQSIENLHAACPKNLGDWYFTGNFPTPGGNQVVNRAFINYMEGKNVRAY